MQNVQSDIMTFRGSHYDLESKQRNGYKELLY